MTELEYLSNEIESHMSYYKNLVKKQDDLAIDMEKRTMDIIRKADEGNKPDREDFLYIDRSRRLYGVVINDLVKTASRIDLLYRIIVSRGFKSDIVDTRQDKGMIEAIVGDFAFMFIKDGNSFELSDDRISEALSSMSERVVPKENLESVVEDLREQLTVFKSNSHAEKAEK